MALFAGGGSFAAGGARAAARPARHHGSRSSAPSPHRRTGTSSKHSARGCASYVDGRASSVTLPSRPTGPPPRRVVYGEVIPDQPSRTATRSRSCIGSIGDPHGTHQREHGRLWRRPFPTRPAAFQAQYRGWRGRAQEGHPVTNVAPARSPMARTIPDPTEYIPGSSKRPARSRSSRTSRESD
jgi:hypothetical protein